MTKPGEERLLAQVAVADATIYYDKPYTYKVPALLEGHIFVGSIVLVPFGRGKTRPRLGVVVQLGREAQPQPRLKEILDAVREEPVLTDELLSIARFLKEQTFCTWFEAVRAVIPKGAQYTTVQEDGVWRLQKKLERISEVVYSLPASVVPATGAAGQHEGRCAGEDADENAGESGTPAEKVQEDGARKLTAKQQAVLAFVQSGPKSRAQICEACGVGASVAGGLAKRGLLCEAQRDKAAEEMDDVAPRWADGALDELAGEDAPAEFSLSDAQQAVAAQLAALLREQRPKPALLYGVTGSGKTLVFLEMIQQTLNAGKTALVLVPEIGLASQMLGGLRRAFGSRVAVQHSGLSNTQRVLQWRGIHAGRTPIVVGTRSAVFAPLQNIGLIVVDEEQEHTYQSENAPRYDAIEVARGRAARHGALLLLASATPSVTSFYAAQTGRYHLVCLAQRFNQLPLPAVELVDMREELMGGNPGVLSARLAGAIEETIAAGRQVILLLNKRGYHRVALCRDCGEAVKCGDCSVPMVFHKGAEGAVPQSGEGPPSGKLVCHYCGKTLAPAPQTCPACGGELRYSGFGTQRLEDELAQRLPRARVLRMDMDTTARKGSHAKLLKDFAAGKADILVGTQMVAKGLDFEKVSLVGVVGIDSLLFGQGYRAFEQVFALVTQVVGRSGRAGAPGRAMIQTVDVAHPVLQLAAKQDYEAFYEEEEGFRKLALYPPFCTLCVAGFVAAEEVDAFMAAQAFARLLVQRAKEKENMPLRVLGPAPMQVAKQAGSWRYRLTIKCRGDAAFRALVWQVLADYNEEGWPRKATAFLDFHADG